MKNSRSFGLFCLIAPMLVCSAARAEERASGGAGGSESPRAAREMEAATRAVNAIEAQSFHVQGELRRARTRSDPHRTTCLDGVLTQLHVAQRAARAHRDAIAVAAARGDAETVERATVRLVHLRDRTARLFSVAGRCGDRDVVIDGARTTTVRVIAPLLPEGAAYPRPPRP